MMMMIKMRMINKKKKYKTIFFSVDNENRMENRILYMNWNSRPKSFSLCSIYASIINILFHFHCDTLILCFFIWSASSALRSLGPGCRSLKLMRTASHWAQYKYYILIYTAFFLYTYTYMYLLDVENFFFFSLIFRINFGSIIFK